MVPHSQLWSPVHMVLYGAIDTYEVDNNNNKHLRCGNRKGLLPLRLPHLQFLFVCFARSKRPNTPSDGSKHNGFQTTNQAVLIPKHVSRQDRAHDQLPITNYQMALSKQGAGGGSATHKEPT